MSNQMSYSAALSGTNTSANTQAGSNQRAESARTIVRKASQPSLSPKEQARWNFEQGQERRARRREARAGEKVEYLNIIPKGPSNPRSHEDALRRGQSPTIHRSPPQIQRPQDSRNTSPRSQHTHQPSSGTSRRHEDQGGYTAAEYERKEQHKPRTVEGKEEDVYILSLRLTSSIHRFLTNLRKTHFPAHLNKLSGHIALFRALPASQLPLIKQTVHEVCASTAPFDLEPSDTTRMRKGVLVNFGTGSREAKQVHRQLLDAWKEHDWLSMQDLGAFKVHVTVMNKVDDEDAIQRALQDVEAELKNFRTRQNGRDQALGIGLFKYDKGYWRFQEDFQFEGAKDQSRNRSGDGNYHHKLGDAGRGLG